VTLCVLVDAIQGFLLCDTPLAWQKSSIAAVAVAASMPPMPADHEPSRSEGEASIRSRIAVAHKAIRAETRTACTASGKSSESELLALMAAAATEPVQRPRR